MCENNKGIGFIEKLNCVEKRIEDTKNTMNIVVTALGIIFVAFAIFAGFSLKQERESLSELRNDTERKIDEMLGQAQKEPDIVCTTITGEPLEGSTIKGILRGSKVEYHYMIKNIGNGETTNLKSQMYSKEPLVIANTKASDEELFDYISVSLSQLHEKEPFALPPGYATVLDGEFNIVSNKEKAIGIHPMMIKVYYGKEKPLRISFNILIENELK